MSKSISPTISKTLAEVLEFQNKLNIITNGKRWSTGIAKNGKEINWHRTILMEAAELLDSTPWKHWSNSLESDKANIIIETIDLFHFIVSLLLEDGTSKKVIIDLLLLKHSNSPNIEVSNDYKDIIFEVENLMRISLLVNKPLHNHPYGAEYLDSFFKLCRLQGISLELLCEIYFAKNTLNRFRLDNGYKEGNYTKIWNYNNSQLEDNKVLLSILESMIESNDKSQEAIYQNLTKIYNNGKF